MCTKINERTNSCSRSLPTTSLWPMAGLFNLEVQLIVFPVFHWPLCLVASKPWTLFLETLAWLTGRPNISVPPAWWEQAVLLHYLCSQALDFISECPAYCPWKGYVRWHFIVKKVKERDRLLWSSFYVTMRTLSWACVSLAWYKRRKQKKTQGTHHLLFLSSHGA